MTAVSRPDRRGQLHQKADLIKRDHRAPPSGLAPSELDLGAFTIADALFQPRESSLLFRAGASADHVKTMVRIVAQGRSLAPMVVAAFGDAWVLIDGHHRYQAYLEADRREPVPVEVAESLLRGESRVGWAVTLSVELNSRDKLAMSPSDKMEAAWRLTVLGAGSKKEIRSATNASTSSIANMRQTRELLLSHGVKAAHLPGMTWKDAKWERNRLENGEQQARPEAEAARLCALIHGLSAHVGERTPPIDMLMEALEALRPGITRDIRDYSDQAEEARAAEEEAEEDSALRRLSFSPAALDV